MKIKDERGCIIDVSEEEAIQRLRKRNAEDIDKELFNNNIILIIDEKHYKELCLKITDLEAKLAESEKDLEIVCVEGKDTIREYAEITNSQQEEIFKLKHQLVEEKNRNKKLNHEAQKYYEDAYCNGLQNKTAIAELEKVKEKISYYLLKFDYFTPKQLTQVEKMIKAIDQQIKSLKGEK